MKTRSDLAGYLAKNKFNLGAEIGVAYGLYSEELLQANDKLTLYCVDPWIKQDSSVFPDNNAIGNYHEAYIFASGKLHRFKDRAKITAVFSNQFFKQIENNTLDFVYIDGNHTSPQIDFDLENSLKAVRSGGIIAGHDYKDIEQPSYRCTVKTAVDKFCHENKLKVSFVLDNQTDTPTFVIFKP